VKEEKTMQQKFRIGKSVFCLWLIFSALPWMGFESLHAQTYPAKPINVVIPLGAGGQNDLLMRMLAPFAPEYFGQPFVIRIVTGGAGAIGSNEVAQSKPDGYTLLSGHANCNTVLPAVEGRGKGPDDLTPIARIWTGFAAYWVQTDAPWKTLKELIAWAKANPGKLVYGNAGTWSANDFSWRWLEMNAGFTSRNVPYDGGAEATIALLGGHVQAARLASGHSFPHWRAGKIRPLAIAGSERIPEMPDVPSLLELGYDMKGLGASWIGVFAPKGTPRPMIDRLAAGFKKITENKKAITAVKTMGADFSYLGPDEFAKEWREEFLAYKELAKIFKK
jgi:tripartite-type tricarboxylate transporter receptor subunit TctC